MRPQRIDITGTTDASGNASIPVKLPVTGEWFDLKFALQLPSSAEWGITVSGTPVTFGRGRRVTLGPELIQAGEMVTVTVTGGPVKAQITGSANGRSGPPDDILAGFVPSPNTIALDTFNEQRLLGTILTAGIGDTPSKTFPLPAGTQGIGFLIDQNAGHGNPLNTVGGITMVGSASAYTYILWGRQGGFPRFVQSSGANEILTSIDPSIICKVVDPNTGTPVLVYFYAYSYNPKTRADSTPNVGVGTQNLIAASWQACTGRVSRDDNLTQNTDTTFLSASAGQSWVLVGQWSMSSGTASQAKITLNDGPSANGIEIARFLIPTAGTPAQPIDMAGYTLGSGNALICKLLSANQEIITCGGWSIQL